MEYFQTKNPKLEFPWNGKCWYILWPFGNLVVIWYIFPVLVYFIEINLATLIICVHKQGFEEICIPRAPLPLLKLSDALGNLVLDFRAG
jgi:hypothetical protein